MKIRATILGVALATTLAFAAKTSFMHNEPTAAASPVSVQAKSIHSFSIQGIDGKKIDFSAYKGKKILVVNTASMCGYTPQYEALENLYKKHKNKLVIVGFPTDNFGGQEYGSDAETAAFCKKNYGVTFPLTTRVNVKGANATPIFKFLTSKSENGVLDANISWNFCKFMLDENGNVLEFFPSKVTPDSDAIAKYLK
ncbi:MAG: glutathione peroxidase [Bacteroidetes bacterium]|nr:MAG: glutathione peroxidase [Bacteroidota bacterium]